MTEFKIYRIKWYDRVLGLGIFLVALVNYIRTLTPSVCAGDSGELTTAIYSMGAAHPPGYPIYCILGKLFTFIPVGNIAYRVNLLSAVFGALTVLIFFFWALRMLGMNRDEEGISLKIHGPAVVSALMFAFTELLWSQAVIGEVYTVNSFLSALMLYSALLWYEDIEYYRNKTLEPYYAEPKLLLVFFVMGLNLTSHLLPVGYIVPLVLVLIPYGFYRALEGKIEKRPLAGSERLLTAGVFVGVSIAVALILYYRAWKVRMLNDSDALISTLALLFIPVAGIIYKLLGKFIANWREDWFRKLVWLYGKSVGVFLVPLSVYYYLIIRAWAVFRMQYAEERILSWGDTRTLTILWNHILRKQYGLGGTPFVHRLGEQLWNVLKWHVNQVTLPNFLFIFPGIYYLFKKIFIWGVLTVFIVLFFSVGLMIYINPAITPRDLYFPSIFFIPSYFIMLLWIAFGFQWVLDTVEEAYFSPKEASNEN